ncbi:DNA-binding protein [Pseudomonas sp. MPB03]|uniref:helix-turn-helix domain-containing transcriptional regulator n=1 Tax=Pseudomonas sp. MPB03 TaxID=3388489 RepID=UPI0039849BD3
MALTRNYKHMIAERAKSDPAFAQILRDEAFTRFDAASYLQTAEEELAYLDACLEEDKGDGVLIRAALNDIARANDIAQAYTGADRERLDIK